MSIVNREPPVAALGTDATLPAALPLERIDATTAEVGGGLRIRRALPTRRRRMVGPWCFLDHFGPADVSSGEGLRVNPHPHIGLQTVTWLLEGEIVHRDSLGSVQLIRPGALNLMTAGRGIAHSETSPRARSPGLLGAQLWIALPDESRAVAPHFDHYAELPVVQRGLLRITVLAGEALGQESPARIYSPLVGLDLAFTEAGDGELLLDPDFEHAVLVLQGEGRVADEPVEPGVLLYLGQGHRHLRLAGSANARLLLVGGQPFAHPVLMWWNFVARSKDEILRACQDWNAGADYFGSVADDAGPRLTAPLPPWEQR